MKVPPILWLLLASLVLVACKGAQPRPAVVPTRAGGATVRTPPPAVATATLAATPLTDGPLVVVSPRPSPTRQSAEATRPVMGGLVDPATVPWFSTTSADPLAHLLGQQLHGSLLDPLTGEPRLAAAWTLRGTRASFTLAPDAAWSDGSTLRAADVADMLLQGVAAGELGGVAGARALDAQTVEVTLVAPTCPALMGVATWPLVDVREWPPQRTSSAVTVEEGTGEWWQLGPSAFDYRRYPDELALRAAWERGEINSVLEASRLTMGPLPGAEANTTVNGPLLATLLFRTDDSLLQAAQLREALTLATDRAALYKAAYGTPPPALLSALLPPGHWAAPDPLPPADLARAAALLDQAGWRAGSERHATRTNATGDPLRLTLALPLSSDPRWEALAHELALQWSKVGVELLPRYAEPYPLRERLHLGQWQVALVAYLVSPDPDQRALWSAPAPDDLMGNDLNLTGYRDSAAGELMAQGAQVPDCALPTRARFYREAWAQLLTDRPLWPLFPLPLDEAHRPDVQWHETGQ